MNSPAIDFESIEIEHSKIAVRLPLQRPKKKDLLLNDYPNNNSIKIESPVASISIVSLWSITPGGMASKTRLKGTSAVYSFENLVKNQNTKDRPKKRRKNRSFCF